MQDTVEAAKPQKELGIILLCPAVQNCPASITSGLDWIGRTDEHTTGHFIQLDDNQQKSFENEQDTAKSLSELVPFPLYLTVLLST